MVCTPGLLAHHAPGSPARSADSMGCAAPSEVTSTCARCSRSSQFRCGVPEREFVVAIVFRMSVLGWQKALREPYGTPALGAETHGVSPGRRQLAHRSAHASGMGATTKEALL